MRRGEDAVVRRALERRAHRHRDPLMPPRPGPHLPLLKDICCMSSILVKHNNRYSESATVWIWAGRMLRRSMREVLCMSVDCRSLGEKSEAKMW